MSSANPCSDEPAAAAGRPRRRHRPTPRWSRRSTGTRSAEVVDDLSALGRRAGSARGPRARDARPTRTTRSCARYDRYGNRIDEVDFHPSWHWLMDAGGRPRAAGRAVGADAEPDAHVRRAAGFFAWSQTEPGHGCPISMTYAAVPALRADDALAKEWTPRLAAPTYDPGLRPAAEQARRCWPAWA